MMLTEDERERIEDYGCVHGAWGSLHIVLSDGNTEDQFVAFCVTFAEEQGDPEGAELARILLRLTEAERQDLYAELHGGYRPWDQAPGEGEV
jgi:hypothetical protein